jgi:hypothetical protein
MLWIHWNSWIPIIVISPSDGLYLLLYRVDLSRGTNNDIISLQYYFVHQFKIFLIVGRNLRATDHRLVLWCIFCDVIIAGRMCCYWMDIWYINYVADILFTSVPFFKMPRILLRSVCANIWNIDTIWKNGFKVYNIQTNYTPVMKYQK